MRTIQNSLLATLILLTHLAVGKENLNANKQLDSFIIANHTNQIFFGSVQAIDGEWLVIGAAGSAIENQHGMVFVYKKTINQWLLHTTLQADNPTTNDGFGSHISISDKQIFITKGSHTTQAFVYIYELNSSVQWIKTAKFETSEFIGNLAAHTHNRIVLGYSARLIEKTNNQWLQTHEFFPNHLFELQAVDLDKNQVIFGFDEHAQIHSFTNGQWQLSNTLQPDDVSIINDTEFGKSVSIHNNWAGVGAFHDNDNGKWFAGAAYVYQKNNGAWQEVKKILLSDGEEGDFFGFSLSNRNDQFIIATASPLATGAFHFRPDEVGSWQETHLLDNTGFHVSHSLDHAIACNREKTGSCTIFTIPLFKADFE